MHASTSQWTSRAMGSPPVARGPSEPLAAIILQTSSPASCARSGRLKRTRWWARSNRQRSYCALSPSVLL
eukprot:2920657-Prymnesium_polylepis.1